MGHELPGPNQKLNTMDNTMGNEESGKNADLIKALQDQDKASADIDKIKETEENEGQQTI